MCNYCKNYRFMITATAKNNPTRTVSAPIFYCPACGCHLSEELEEIGDALLIDEEQKKEERNENRSYVIFNHTNSLYFVQTKDNDRHLGQAIWGNLNKAHMFSSFEEAKDIADWYGCNYSILPLHSKTDFLKTEQTEKKDISQFTEEEFFLVPNSEKSTSLGLREEKFKVSSELVYHLNELVRAVNKLNNKK